MSDDPKCAHAMIVFSGKDGGLKCLDCEVEFVLASRLGTTEQDLGIMQEAVEQQILEYRAEIENSARKDAQIAELREHIDGLVFRLKNTETERNSYASRLGSIRRAIERGATSPSLDVRSDAACAVLDMLRQWDRGVERPEPNWKDSLRYDFTEYLKKMSPEEKKRFLDGDWSETE